MQQGQWEEDSYRDKIGAFNVVNYDSGDSLITTSNTYTMSAAMSGE